MMPKKKKIIVSTQKNGNTISVMIQDFGIGIPKRQQKKVFDLYFRGDDSQSTSVTGLGVGLYISAQIIKQHTGKMGVTSSPGKGAKFFFTLPLAQKKLQQI